MFTPPNLRSCAYYKKQVINMKFDTVIFDLDGTLLNTIEDLKDSVNHILLKYGYAERTLSEVTSFVGNGLGRLLTLCLPQGDKTEGFSDMLTELREYYAAHSVIKTDLYPGIDEMLRALSKEGVKLAIVTNKPDGAANKLHEIFFKETVGFTIGEKSGIARKPAPDGVLCAISRLGSDRSSCLYVGDSEVDKMTADNADLACALVSWGFRGKEAVCALRPDFVIDSPSELLEIIK